MTSRHIMQMPNSRLIGQMARKRSWSKSLWARRSGVWSTRPMSTSTMHCSFLRS